MAVTSDAGRLLETDCLVTDTEADRSVVTSAWHLVEVATTTAVSPDA